MVRILVLAAPLVVALVGSAHAVNGATIVVSEPVSLGIFGGGIGLLYLVKKLRG